jgi:hypothetical protein
MKPEFVLRFGAEHLKIKISQKETGVKENENGLEPSNDRQ